jgi:hypothetical protein
VNLTSPGSRRRIGAPGVRRLAVAIACTVVASPVHAQQVPDRETAIEVRKQFVADLDTLQHKFMALANAIPADKYSWRPAPGVRSVGEVFMHVASEFYVYTPMAYGAPASPVVGRGADALKHFESMSSKPEVLKHLKEGFDYAAKSLLDLDPAKLAGQQKLFGGNHTIIETSFDMTDDLHEHLGQLIAYARMNGVVPPWSK